MKYKDYVKIIDDLEKESISVFDMGVAYEIKCCLEYQDRQFTDEELETLYTNVYNAYMKTDEVNLNSLVWTCIKHFDELDDLGSWELVSMSIE